MSSNLEKNFAGDDHVTIQTDSGDPGGYRGIHVCSCCPAPRRSEEGSRQYHTSGGM